MAKLFEYAIIHNPKPTKDAQGNDTTKPASLLVEPKHILAKDDKEVAMRGAREIPETHLDKLDEVEVLVRPSSRASSAPNGRAGCTGEGG